MEKLDNIIIELASDIKHSLVMDFTNRVEKQIKVFEMLTKLRSDIVMTEVKNGK